MKMNRRNVLVGLGTIVAGGGAALGTGAFSSVQADRTVSLDVASDSSALLGISVTDAIAGSGEEATIDLSASNLDADGLNIDATTVFEEAVTITNQGSDDVTSISFDADTSGTAEIDSINFDLSDGQDEPSTTALTTGNGLDYDLEIVTTEDASDGGSFNITVTISASTS